MHAERISKAPKPVFHPIVSPSKRAANAVPQMGSVDRITVDSVAEIWRVAHRSRGGGLAKGVDTEHFSL